MQAPCWRVNAGSKPAPGGVVWRSGTAALQTEKRREKKKSVAGQYDGAWGRSRRSPRTRLRHRRRCRAWRGFVLRRNRVSPVRRDGKPQAGAPEKDGVAAERRKLAQYPELTRGGPHRLLCVLAAEIGGRWNDESQRLVQCLKGCLSYERAPLAKALMARGHHSKDCAATARRSKERTYPELVHGPGRAGRAT